nr:vitamin K epoxide reductase family protein [Aquimarina litoralis]
MDELNLQLVSHPNFPNLIAIVDLFNHLGIEHYALELQKELSILAELPKYFLAHIIGDKGPQLALISMKRNKLVVKTGKKEEQIISKEEFIKIWSGIVICINDEKSEVNERSIGSTSVQSIVLTATLVSIIAIMLKSDFTTFQLISFVLSIVGAFISFLIIQQEIGSGSSAVAKFCNASEKTSCEATINSKGALLFGVLKLSDMGIVYFSSLLLLWLLSSISTTSLAPLVILAGYCSIPMMLYSVVYQWLVIKKWCLLCLGIVSVLLVQFLSSFIDNQPLNQLLSAITLNQVLLFSFGILIVMAIWFFIKPLLKKDKELSVLKIQHLKFKRNFNFFKASLVKESPINNINIPDEIVLGNPSAPIALTLITNPLCSYCKKAHEAIDKILDIYPHKVKVVIRFSVDFSNIEDTATQIAHHLIHIYSQKGESSCRNALNDIYGFDSNQGKKKWLENQFIDIHPAIIKVLQEQKVWGINEKVYLTPTLLVNNYVFNREEYIIEDLLYFIEDLQEENLRYELV